MDSGKTRRGVKVAIVGATGAVGREMKALLAERGFPVIMGSRAFIHFKVDSIPRGI